MLTNAAQGAPHAARIGAVATMLLLAGCQVQQRGPAVPPSPSVVAVASPAAAADARQRGAAWPVDAEHTVVTIIVRRDGPLAQLGHDHVITSADETGTVWIGATPGQSAFEVSLPVEQLDVDLPGPRAAAGPGFATAVPDEARAGTRRNLLRTEVLDAAGHPFIVLRSIAATGDWSQPLVRVAVELRGVTRELEIPIAIERDAQHVTARGEVRFNQSDFGITPFAVAGGAIQVADELEVRFEIAARAP